MIEVTKSNREQIRMYYFSLCEQGKANFLYDNRISGARLMLSPNQYPSVSPMHRRCDCGAEAKTYHLLGFDKDDCYVACPDCGCKSTKEWSPFWAWQAWDNYQLETDPDNMTIWDLLH